MDTGQKVKHLNSICVCWILRSKRTGCQLMHVPPGHKFNYSKQPEWAKQKAICKPLLDHPNPSPHYNLGQVMCTHTQRFHWQWLMKQRDGRERETHKSWQNIWPTSLASFFCALLQIFKHGKDDDADDDDEVISKNKQNVGTVLKSHKVTNNNPKKNLKKKIVCGRTERNAKTKKKTTIKKADCKC